MDIDYQNIETASDKDFIEFWRRDLASQDARKDNVEGIELSVFYEALDRLEKRLK